MKIKFKIQFFINDYEEKNLSCEINGECFPNQSLLIKSNLVKILDKYSPDYEFIDINKRYLK